MELKKSEFYYALPKGLIAQTPIPHRDRSRLLVMDRRTGAVSHRRFYEVPDLLCPGDCLVMNDTRVIPARLLGMKEETGVLCELLLLKNMGSDRWETMVRPGRRLPVSAKVVFGEGLLIGEIERVLPGGNRLVRFYYEGIFNEILDKLGVMPLPPYITEKLSDGERYQTIYAKHPGSAAAPTAGLHFTKELLSTAEKRGVSLAYLTLHVGIGTFRPVKEERVADHKMHSEWYAISGEAAEIINRTRDGGGRVIAVGTTACRTLETVGIESGHVRSGAGDTDIFIYPGYTFKVVDGLITNFHLPESTLLMLVSAFSSRENILNAYEKAVLGNEEGPYRFFSFGDAMMII